MTFSQPTAGEGETGLGPVASNCVLFHGDPQEFREVIANAPGRVRRSPESLKELQAQLKPLTLLFRIFGGEIRLHW